MKQRISILVGTLLAACMLCASLVHAATATTAEKNSSAATDDSATRILANLRSGIVKVNIVSAASGSETGNGTGFVVDSSSLLVTNYHVTADIVLNPGQYRLEYESIDGSRGKLEILALDVVNDLALLKPDRPLVAAAIIPIAEHQPDRGDTVLAIGYPLSKGLTIVSGTYNGFAEDYYQQQIHYSGAINSGMSGGPAVDSGGALVGVNRAVTLNAQLVGLLVPASKVMALLESPRPKDISAPNFWRSEVGRQLNTFSQTILSTLLKNPLPTRKFDSYVSVDLEPLGFKCDGVHQDPNGKYPSSLDGRVCSTASAVHVDPNSYFGSMDLYTGIRTNMGISSLRFAEIRRTHFDFRKKISDDPDKNKTGYECTDRLLNLNGVRVNAAACFRKDYRFADLYDTTLVVHGIDSDRQSIQVRAEMRGLPFEGSKALIGRVLGGLGWSR